MLALARQVTAYPDFSLAQLDTGTLDDRDAALAHAIYDAVLRRWLTLSFIVNAALTRPMEEIKPHARAALLAGAAQLLLLDRIPPHAAIHETVEWAKGHVAGGLVRMINGVLRNIGRLVEPRSSEPNRRPGPWVGARDQLPLSDGFVRVLGRPILPADELPRLAVATGVPESLLHAWSSRLGPEEARRQALHTLVDPPIVVNASHATSTPAGDAWLTHDRPGMLIWAGPHGALRDTLATRTNLWVQDAASAHPVALARSIVGDLEGPVLDLCAGQGTKSRQLAAAFPHASVIATDIDVRRRAALHALAGRVQRLKVIEPADIDRYEGTASLVLLDVPCSNSGVLARRPEAKYRWGSAQFERLGVIQRDLIATGARLLRPQGILVYATCSTDPEENSAQAAFAATLGFHLLCEEQTMPNAQPGDGPQSYLDGSYAAILRKTP